MTIKNAVLHDHASIPTGSQLVQRARDLSTFFSEQAAEAERLRRPTDAAIEALKKAQIFELMTPRIYGGAELDLDTFFEVGLALSEGDASLAWVSNFYIEHVWIFSLFPKAFQDEVFAQTRTPLAPAMLSPNGRVTKEPGGYRLNGRWSWSTGIMHADWVLPAAIVTGENGKRAPMFFALPRAQVTVEDTWFVNGMQGTGSNDVLIEDVFIPDGRMLSFQQMIEGKTPGGQFHSNPLYRTPMLPMLGLAAAMPAVGQARNCVRLFKEKLMERKAQAGARRVGTSSYMRLARAEVQVEQIYLMLRSLVDDVMTKRDSAERLDRTRWATQLAIAVEQSKAVINNLADAAGASAHFQSNALGRAARDVGFVGAHIVFDLDARLELHGAALLGDEIPGILV